MKLRPFELALVIIFVVLGLVALFLMSVYSGGSSDESPSTTAISNGVQIWGTMPGQGVTDLIALYQETNESYRNVRYTYVPPDRFNQALVTALADGQGPDLVLISQEELVDVRRRLLPDSYETFPPRDIRSRYIDGAEIFALQDGLQARPIAVDPLVLFWNRDILATNGHLQPPKTWLELMNVQFDDLIDRSFDRTINRAVVAMGEYTNVKNAFGVVSMLLVQGNMIGVTESGQTYEIILDRSRTNSGSPIRAVTEFYTRFSRPANTLYSWNRSFSEDRSEFISGDLAFYFGYASEGPEIERLNPNLNFDIAEVPQNSSAPSRRTYARFYGLAILRTTDNFAGAQAVHSQFSSIDAADMIAINSSMVPTTRQTVNQGSNTTYGRLAYQSAAISYGWLNPNKQNTDQIFNTMMQDINENRRSLDESVRDALGRLELEY